MKRLAFIASTVTMIALIVALMGCDKKKNGGSTGGGTITPSNHYKVADTTVAIKSAISISYVEDGVPVTAIGFLPTPYNPSMNIEMIESYCAFVFLGAEIPIGTFVISENGTFQCDSEIKHNGVSYDLISGTLIISKSGEEYTFELKNAKAEYDGINDHDIQTSMSCYYKGTFTAISSDDNYDNFYKVDNEVYPIAVGAYGHLDTMGQSMMALVFSPTMAHPGSDVQDAMFFGFINETTLQEGTFQFSMLSITSRVGALLKDGERYILTQGKLIIEKRAGGNYFVKLVEGVAQTMGKAETASKNVMLVYEGTLIDFNQFTSPLSPFKKLIAKIQDKVAVAKN